MGRIRFQISASNSLMLLAIILLIIVNIINQSTYDTGDSIMHFLYARNAPNHPMLYLEHWGKPLFTLLASPFAMFGWTGMKLFNLLVVILTACVTASVSEKLFKGSRGISAIFFIGAPNILLITSSGLTEPLFGLILILALYAEVLHKYWLSAIIISFSLFSRSEGQIILIVWACWSIYNLRWKQLPFFMTGFLLYAIIGFLSEYNDFWWYFTKNPYDQERFVYGSGDWDHFIKSFIYLTGPFITFFAALGVVVSLVKSIPRFILEKDHLQGIRVLAFLCLSGYLFFHSYAWASGQFGSYGLLRVIMGIYPFAVIVILSGFYQLRSFLYGKAQLIFTYLVLFLVCLFPFSGMKYSIRQVDLKPNPSLLQMQECLADIDKNEFPELVSAAPLPAFVLGVDYFDETKFQYLNSSETILALNGAYIVWDHHFAGSDLKLPAHLFLSEPSRFELIKTCVPNPGQKGDSILVFKLLKAQ